MTAHYPPPDQQPYTQQQQYPPWRSTAPRKRRRRWPWILLGTIIVLIIIAVAASSGGGSSARPTAASGSSQLVAPPPPAAPPAPSSTTNHFGDATRFTDGLTVSVAAPQPFTPSDSAAGWTPGQKASTFAITVTNGSQQNYDPRLLSTSVRSGQTEGSQIFDTARGLEGPPSTAVLPGQSVTFSVGFTVADPGSVVVQVTPGFQYNNAIFTN